MFQLGKSAAALAVLTRGLAGFGAFTFHYGEASVTSPSIRAQLSEIYPLQRKAQWRLDFVGPENSMGFHAPQETARIPAEAIDYALQGQIAAKARGITK